MKKINIKEYSGLLDKDVINSRKLYGKNEIGKDKKKPFILRVIDTFKEPMFLLLLVASVIYFILGEIPDGIIMLVSVLAMCFIDFFQQERTSKAVEELNKLSSLEVVVIRNGEEIKIDSKEVVVDDIVILDEGDKVPADGVILESYGFGVDESLLTGESISVYKSEKEDKENHFKLNMVYSGTIVTNGYAIVKITQVGVNTEIGKIGSELKNIVKEKSPLEHQVNKLVLICTIISFITFLLVIIINLVNLSDLSLKSRIVESVLSGITIAMATIPEELPVILTVFLAMGSLELSRKKTLTKSMKSIETLGAVTVLCTDKTGTLTENKMVVSDTLEYNKDFYKSLYLSCLSMAYDPMEIAIKNHCDEKIKLNMDRYELVYEYIFDTKTKMVGNVWKNNNKNILCIKGASETVLKLCNLSNEEKEEIENKIEEYSKEGYRVLAVGYNDNVEKIEKNIKNYTLTFVGLVALYDPPRKGIKESLNKCYNASIRTIMITGDSGLTASGIAKKINLLNSEEVITGFELEKMSDEELQERVKTVNIFARVYPTHKMRIVNALQKNGEIVAMTGDGINDAPALKKSNIGIAMGERGTSVAKESADLILLDDNFNTIVSAIENGRSIYKNIRKAISFILAIHIPIILLSVIIPLLKLPAMLYPIHIVLMELLLDPTSSIVFQKIKPDKNIMEEKPRNSNEFILDYKTLIRCISQGLWIFIVVIFNYLTMIYKGLDVNLIISECYLILILSIMLISYELVSKELTIKNIINCFKQKICIIIDLFILICLIVIIYVPFFNDVAHTTSLSLNNWLLVIIMTIIAVIPFDIFKVVNKLKKKR